MRKTPRMIVLLGLATAVAWVGAGMAAQMTGSQARAAQNLAAQAGSGSAPQGAAPAGAAAPAQTAPAPAGTPAPASSGGRRDPFRPLVVLGPTAADQLPARLPPGKAGLVIGQLTIQGIVRGLNGQWIAVVDNKTNRAYFLYAGDELYNGTVSRITQGTVVFQERVNDATGQTRTREVIRQLSPS